MRSPPIARAPTTYVCIPTPHRPQLHHQSHLLIMQVHTLQDLPSPKISAVTVPSRGIAVLNEPVISSIYFVVALVLLCEFVECELRYADGSCQYTTLEPMWICRSATCRTVVLLRR